MAKMYVRGACSIVCCWSWAVVFFLLPVVLGTFIITVVCDYFYGTRRARLSTYWLITLLAGSVLSIAHGAVYVILQSVTADKINDKGGVLMLDTFYVFSLAIFALAYLWHIRKKGVTSPIAISLLLSFGFSLALLVFQKITTGDTSYYYYKSILSLLLLAGLVGTLLMVFIYDKVSSYGARTLLLVSAILFSLSNGVGVFGAYFSGGVKSAFSAPYLFDHVIAIVENPVCRDRSTAILSIRSYQKTDGDIFFNRSLMALSGRATDVQEIIARWSMSSADILIARSTIAKAIAESENIRPDSRL